MRYAKATNDTDRAPAVLVSFDAKWKDHIVRKTIRAVIRKRIPTSSAVDWIYFYINSPVSAVIGRAKLDDCRLTPGSSLVSKASFLQLSREEISQYVGEESAIGIYEFSEIDLAKREVPLKKIQTSLIFSPPQSFLFLSKHGKAAIDRMAGLSIGEEPLE